ncbi:hypothetical protein L208DRAFT_1406878, partial [Tricholoma matsutake]
MFEGPQTLRLVQIGKADNVAEEAVFTIQGILSEKDLPPVTKKVKNPSQACYLRQGVTLVGYGTPTFEDALDATQEIYGFFDRNVQEGSLENPRGILESLAKPNFVYGEDNEVL